MDFLNSKWVTCNVFEDVISLQTVTFEVIGYNDLGSLQIHCYKLIIKVSIRTLLKIFFLHAGHIGKGAIRIAIFLCVVKVSRFILTSKIVSWLAIIV